MVNLDLDKIDFSSLAITKTELKEWLEEHGDKVDNANELWLNLPTYVLSGVENPAHRSEFFALKSVGSDDEGDVTTEELTLLKTKEEEEFDKVAYAAALVPNEKDKEGDIIPDVVVEKSAHDFMENFRNDEVDVDHETPKSRTESIRSRGTVVESWLLQEEEEFETINGGVEVYPEKTWMVAIKFKDEEAWERVKNGEIKGWSIMGKPSVVKSTSLLHDTNDNTNMDNNNVSIDVDTEKFVNMLADEVSEKVMLPEPEPEVEVKEVEVEPESFDDAVKSLDDVDTESVIKFLSELMDAEASEVKEAIEQIDSEEEEEEDNEDEEGEDVESEESEKNVEDEVDRVATEKSQESEDTETSEKSIYSKAWESYGSN